MGENRIPYIETKNGKPVLIVKGKPFIMLAGEVHNSDSSSPKYMEKIWDIAEDLGMNTLLLPATWELTEPEEGVFDFSVPKALIDQARGMDMKIVFLWFGSWKNAECMYAPAWVKKDLEISTCADREGKKQIRKASLPDDPREDALYYTVLSRRGDDEGGRKSFCRIHEVPEGI